MLEISFHRLDWFLALLVVSAGLYASDVANDGDAERGATGVSTSSHGGMPADQERPFITDMQRVMDKMMAAMATKTTGNTDADFAAMMIPHHQGAIDMAVLELRYGSNEQLRRIAQEIIVSQQQEIAAMRLALGEALGKFLSTPTHAGADSATDSIDAPVQGRAIGDVIR